MNFLKLFLATLPTAIKYAGKIGQDLQGHQKKQIVTDILAGLAEGVGQASPEHAEVAAGAAELATQMIDQVHASLKSAGVLAPSVPAPTPDTLARAATQ